VFFGVIDSLTISLLVNYVSAIRACAKGGKTERALSLFQVVKDKGLPLDSYCYTAAIEACDSQQALKLLKEMEERGIEPSEVAYSVTIKACGAGGHWRRALDLVDTMRSKKMPVNLYVYNAAITAVSKAAKQLSKSGDSEVQMWKEVMVLLDAMRRDGIDPDGFSFSSAISCCGSEGRWKEALELIDVMLKGGPKTRPNKIAYTAAISSCGRAGQVDHALRLFRQMKEQGLSADRVAYNAMFSALRVSKRSEAAFALWDEMLGRPSKQSGAVTIAAAKGSTDPDIITVTE
jgi:pentatricopeptide repeat domain-containing protein 1